MLPLVAVAAPRRRPSSGRVRTRPARIAMLASRALAAAARRAPVGGRRPALVRVAAAARVRRPPRDGVAARVRPRNCTAITTGGIES